MTEYITKQQAINVVNTAFGHIYDTDSETVSLVDLQNEIVMTIEQYTETADSVEVVPAHWKFYGENGHGYGEWMCTRCGSVTGEKYAKNYCPRCGARMDGDKS